MDTGDTHRTHGIAKCLYCSFGGNTVTKPAGPYGARVSAVTELLPAGNNGPWWIARKRCPA